MVKEIVKDEAVLRKASEKFIFGDDDHIIQDLIDTANAHAQECAGLAAVQIGYHKNAFVVWNKDKKRYVPFINPRIILRGGGTYKTYERCLSVDGEHEVMRHNNVSLIYYSTKGERKSVGATGYYAQVIQHEYDHLNGGLL